MKIIYNTLGITCFTLFFILGIASDFTLDLGTKVIFCVFSFLFLLSAFYLFIKGKKRK